jgi:hypothetical protein
VAESAQMPLLHDAAPLHGQVRPRQGPVSAGDPVSGGGVLVSGVMGASVSGVVLSPGPESSSPASTGMQALETGSQVRPALHPVTVQGATHWCETGSHTSLPGQTAGPWTHSKSGTSLPMATSQPPPAATTANSTAASVAEARAPCRV